MAMAYPHNHEKYTGNPNLSPVPIDLRLSVVPWPAHLADLRQHPGDIVLQVNVGRTVDKPTDAEHERNRALAKAIIVAAQPEILRMATALHEAMSNVGRCEECGTAYLESTCPYCAGSEDGEAYADGARRALEFSTKQQEMLGAQLELRDRRIKDLEAERECLIEGQLTLRRQRDLAQHDAEMSDRSCARQREMKEDWIDRYHELADLHARIRKGATLTLAAIVGTAAAASLGWLCWDRLPGWSPDAIERWRILVSLAIGALGTHLWLKSKKLPGGNPGKLLRPPPDPTGAGPTPRNTSDFLGREPGCECIPCSAACPQCARKSNAEQNSV